MDQNQQIEILESASVDEGIQIKPLTNQNSDQSNDPEPGFTLTIVLTICA